MLSSSNLRAVFKKRNSCLKLVHLIALLSFLPACAKLPLLSRWSEVNLGMQVTSTARPGVYTVAGKADLPEGTPLTVLAVRYLNPADPASVRLDPEPTYSILAYQSAAVKQGQWQTQLNLWQVADDGRFQETWQLEQARLNMSLKPEADVIFLTTLTPIEELAHLEQELAKRGIRLPSDSILSTTEGFRYAQVEQVMAVALPTGRTTPPAPRPEDDNDGWGDRYIIPQEPPNPTNLEFPNTRTTNAPPAPQEFLR